MKKIPPNSYPAFESVLLVQEDGSVISNAPRNDIPNMTKMTKKNRLAIQLVDRLLSAFAPNKHRYEHTQHRKDDDDGKRIVNAFLIPSARVLLLLVKKLTVIGIIEYTHGVITAAIPPP